jgi:hypothetical protein
MNFKSMVKKVDNKEVLTCILLIIVGYMTAQLFMRKMNGFNVGGQNSCPFKDVTCKLGQSEYPPPSGKSDPCKGISKDKCNKSWYENTIKGGGNNTTPIGIACYWNSSGKDCVTPGTGFKTITDACPTKSCDASPPPGGKTPAGPTPTTYNCSGSMCVNVSGTDGTYSSESDCLNSDCEKTTPSFNCSSSGYFSNDDCYNNKKLVDPYKWHLPSASCTDNNCKGCQNTCSMWYEKWGPYILLILWLVIGIIIGFSLSVGLGISFFFIVSVIEFLILYYINKSVTPELKN